MNTFTKSLFLLTLLFLVVGFSACKKNEFDPMTLRGTWESVENGGKGDEDYRMTETFTFDKFNIGMWRLEEVRGDTRLSYKEYSFDYSVVENTLTVVYADGSTLVTSVSIDKNYLTLVINNKAKTFTRIQ